MQEARQLTCRVFDLSNQLCKAVFEVVYEVNRVVLPLSVIRKEVQKQVSHVVRSLLPLEMGERKGKQLKRGISGSEVSFLEGSPYSRNDTIASDTSVLGTPSSLGAVLGSESKRSRLVLPSFPNEDSVFWVVC